MYMAIIVGFFSLWLDFSCYTESMYIPHALILFISEYICTCFLYQKLWFSHI